MLNIRKEQRALFAGAALLALSVLGGCASTTTPTRSTTDALKDADATTAPGTARARPPTNDPSFALTDADCVTPQGQPGKRARSTSGALRDAECIPTMATPRDRPPSTGPDRTAGALQDADSQRIGTVPNRVYVEDTRGAIVKNPYGLCWRTGFWTPAQANCECDKDLLPKEKCEPPAPRVAEAPPPAPVVPPAPKPVTEKVTLAADVLFDFDKAVLRPEGKAKLDDLVSKIKALNLEVVIAIGHTDRIGSKSYNQRLSERRAAAVKTYLVSQGIEPNRIYTEGKGLTQPVKDCPNPSPKGEIRNRQQLIACLQPNRRVDVEVVGTRTVTK
jgi:OOP family OmpA-OmpF porin